MILDEKEQDLIRKGERVWGFTLFLLLFCGLLSVIVLFSLYPRAVGLGLAILAIVVIYYQPALKAYFTNNTSAHVVYKEKYPLNIKDGIELSIVQQVLEQIHLQRTSSLNRDELFQLVNGQKIDVVSKVYDKEDEESYQFWKSIWENGFKTDELNRKQGIKTGTATKYTKIKL